jgi:hypothetical protein
MENRTVHDEDEPWGGGYPTLRHEAFSEFGFAMVEAPD